MGFLMFHGEWEGKPKVKVYKPMEWKRIELYERGQPFEGKGMENVKAFLKKKGVDVHRYPFDISEDVVLEVRAKDFEKVAKIMKKKKLKEFL
jgi:hypothetical protein